MGNKRKENMKIETEINIKIISQAHQITVILTNSYETISEVVVPR